MLQIILAILAFGVLVIVHEFGHFITAKRGGVQVNEFWIGMGPTLLKHEHKGTMYCLKLLPFGGACVMEGEDGESENEHAFGKAKLPRRMLIVCAGALMNFLVGFLIVLAVLVGPELLSLMMDSRMEDGHLFHQGDSVRVQLFLRGITDFLHNPVFGIGLISQRNSDLFTGVEGSMVFYHNSIAQIMGSMGLVGIAAYGVLMRDRIALLRAGKTPFVRALALSYLGMLLISLTNPGEFCPFPNAALMVMVFALAEEATGDVAVPVGEMLGLRPTRRIYLPQK